VAREEPAEGQVEQRAHDHAEHWYDCAALAGEPTLPQVKLTLK